VILLRPSGLGTALLCEMNRMAIVPANEFFELDALAVFRDLTKAILLHALNLNELRKTRNLQVGNFGICPLGSCECLLIAKDRK
jgi:hypothetical protein